jgi:predicted RNA polymerase sigma factor
MMLVCLGADVSLSPEEAAQIGPATEAWADEMDESGRRLFGSQLSRGPSARTVRVRADLLRRAGRTEEAGSFYRRAIELAGNDAERRYLTGRLGELER